MARLGFKDVLSRSYSRYSWLIMIVCQLIAILCAGTIIYIVAIVFVPTHKWKYSGFSKNAASCSTVSSKAIPGCINPDLPVSLSSLNSSRFQILAWSSCGESCPRPPPDINDTEVVTVKDCHQIRVNIRRFGTDISLEKCKEYNTMNCDGEEESGGTCAWNQVCISTGLYRCFNTKPIRDSTSNETEIIDYEMNCTEVSKYLKCALTTNEEVIDCSSGLVSCLKSRPGLYQCSGGSCSMVEEPVKCHRICKGIHTGGKNVLIHHRDKIHSANCLRARVKSKGLELWPSNYRNFITPTIAPTLLLNCQEVSIRGNYDEYGNHSDSSLILSDCVNGTVLENASLPEEIDIQELFGLWWKEIENDDNLLDPINQKYAPRTSNLSIYWNLPLLFLYDFCGNIPSDRDCSRFYTKHGIPANYYFPQSTFPCFYSNKYRDYTYAVVHPTRLRTEKEIWKEAVIPTVIAVASCFIVLVFSVAVTIIVFLHPLINDSTTESYDDISHTAGKRPSIILTVATPDTPTKTTVHNFLSPGNGNSYLSRTRRSSHPNFNGNNFSYEEARKRVSWVEPGPVLEQRWAY